jgi:uncharacterized membrane protein YoaK (UPF0700 family)
MTLIELWPALGWRMRVTSIIVLLWLGMITGWVTGWVLELWLTGTPLIIVQCIVCFAIGSAWAIPYAHLVAYLNHKIESWRRPCP